MKLKNKLEPTFRSFDKNCPAAHRDPKTELILTAQSLSLDSYMPMISLDFNQSRSRVSSNITTTTPGVHVSFADEKHQF